jgi:hypothetical protein
MVASLRQLLEIAEKGELRGFEFSVEDIRGREKFCALGSYKRRPSHGAQAAMRLAMRMASLEDKRQEEDGTVPGFY